MAVVAFAADDLEVRVELYVDLAAVVEGDLDLVLALLVADFGAGYLAARDATDQLFQRAFDDIADRIDRLAPAVRHPGDPDD